MIKGFSIFVTLSCHLFAQRIYFFQENDIIIKNIPEEALYERAFP